MTVKLARYLLVPWNVNTRNIMKKDENIVISFCALHYCMFKQSVCYHHDVYVH